jgi:hypothetical protein
MNAIKTPNDISALVTDLRSLLNNELGTFDDGTKAFWVEPPFIPSKRTFSGVKIVVARNQDVLQPQKPCVGVPQAIQRMYWRVTLINNDYSSSGLAKWDSAIDKIRRRFPLHRERAVEVTEDQFPQRTFLLEAVKVVNLITV